MQTCPKCGADYYPSYLRCPHCGAGYGGTGGVSTRSAGPSVRVRAPKRRRKLSGPAVAVAVTVGLALLAGGGVLVYYLTLPKDGGTSPDEAARGFARALMGLEVTKAVSYVHPRLRSLATSSAELLRKTKVPLERIVRRYVPVGRSSAIDLEVAQRAPAGQDIERLEIVFKSGGLPMKRSWFLVAKKSGRWYVLMNPFASPGH